MSSKMSIFTGLVILVGLILSPPATAEETPAQSLAVTEVIHLGTFEYSNGTLTKMHDKGGATVLWDNTGFLPNFFSSGTAEILDTGDLPADTYVGQFQVGFATDAVGLVTIRQTFYENNNNGTLGAVLPKVGGGVARYDLTFNVPGGGLFGYNVDIVLSEDDQFRITGPDVDGFPGTDWGYGFTILDPGNTVAGMGPTVSSEVMPPGAPGREASFDIYDPPGVYVGNFVFTSGLFAQFNMQLVQGPGPPTPTIDIPTLSEVGLALLVLMLITAGLMIVWRRRHAAH